MIGSHKSTNDDDVEFSTKENQNKYNLASLFFPNNISLTEQDLFPNKHRKSNNSFCFEANQKTYNPRGLPLLDVQTDSK